VPVVGPGAVRSVTSTRAMASRRVAAATASNRKKEILEKAEERTRLEDLERQQKLRAADAERYLQQFDDNKDGSFDREEMSTLLKKVGQVSEVPDEFLDAVFADEKRRVERLACSGSSGGAGVVQPTTDASGAMSIPSQRAHVHTARFQSWLTKRAQIQAMFFEADANNDESLDLDELKQVLQKGTPPGYTVSEADVMYVMDVADDDASGSLELRELGPAIAAWMDLIRAKKAADTPEPKPASSSACVLL